jgi:hypothetical protein
MDDVMPTIQPAILQVLANSGIPERGFRPPASVSFLLGTGGDRRIWPDTITRRNRYGTRTTPADDEISFSSTTASNISRASFLATGVELARLTDLTSLSPVAFDQWFADIRDRIACSLRCTGAQVVLAASGTDAELLGVCIMASLSSRPWTNVLVAPDETGSGVPRAAAGRHYSDLTPFGSAVEAGAPLEGLRSDRIEVRTVAIRNELGAPSDQQAIDADVIAAVELELRKDRDVVVHVLDTSKTGLRAVTREAARHVAALAPGRVQVVVDACQLRGPISQLRQDLADGFMVALTGSKFIAGPPFSGALLIPPALVDRLTNSEIPAGLADYSAAQDWPVALRQRMSSFAFKSELNLGLGLRWAAALAHLDEYAEINDPLQCVVKEQFVRLVRSRIGAMTSISLHPDDDGDHLGSHAMVPLTVTDGAGSFASLEQCQNIQMLMRDHNGGPICHIGQAVRLGSRTVLRVAASAADVVDVTSRISTGQSLDEAFRPIESRLDAVFQKLSVVLQHLRDA